jgi:diguanylate cyclase (GGDEF)-like protein/PAS domain S-box-containing protein
VTGKPDEPCRWSGTEPEEHTMYGAEARRDAAVGRAPTDLVQHLPVGVFSVDRTGRIIDVNPAWERAMQTSRDDAVGRPLTELLDDSDAEVATDTLGIALLNRGTQRFRAQLPGTSTWVEFTIDPVPGDNDGDDGDVTFAGSVYDVTDAVEHTRLAEVLEAVFEATNDLVGITDDRRGVVYVNPAARRRFGVPEGELSAFTTEKMYPPEAFELYEQEIRPQLLRGEAWAGIVPMYDATGAVIDVWQTVVGGVGPAKTIEWLVSMGRDVTEVKQAQADLEFRATHDALTGLPNRTMLLDHLRLALARRDREERGVGVVFIDLDGFKEVNDRYGHDAGDVVLREVAERLASATRPSDTVSRYGGDEFVVLLDGLGDGLDEATQIAHRLVEAIAAVPIRFGRSVTVTASAGVAVAPAQLDNPERLITAADRLMYRTKRAGGDGVSQPAAS